jgi:hypothetical protein
MKNVLTGILVMACFCVSFVVLAYATTWVDDNWHWQDRWKVWTANHPVLFWGSWILIGLVWAYRIGEWWLKEAK